MRQVNVKVMSPAARYQPYDCRFDVSWVTAQKALAFALICAFWGVILFLALATFQ